MIEQNIIHESDTFTVACCNFYEHKLVQTLLGSSFHPGGIVLTKEIAEKQHFSSTDRILDLASGLGTSALYLAEQFGSTVVGIDLSEVNISKAQKKVEEKHLENLVTFRTGNIQTLPFESESFDYVLIECSFCLFEDKKTVGKEIYRVLKPKGKVVITDIAIEKQLPFEVEHLIYQVACIAHALSMDGYAKYFKESGFSIESLTDRRDILLKMVEDVKKKLFVLELASGLKKIELGSLDVKELKSLITKAKQLLNEGYATYMVLIADKISP